VRTAVLAATILLAGSSLFGCGEPNGRPDNGPNDGPDDGPSGVPIDAPVGVVIDAPGGIPPLDAPTGVPPRDAPGSPPRDAPGSPPIDAPVVISPDAGPVSEPDRLRFSLGDFKIARRQRTRLRVHIVTSSGAVQDVSGSVQLTIDNPQLVTHAGQGVIHSGEQAGTATLTARLGNATPATVKVTVTQVICHPVINELVVGRNGTPADEWIEIFNPCTEMFNVTGWSVVYRGPTQVSDTERVLAPLDGPLVPGAFYIFAGRDFRGFADRTWSDAAGVITETSGAVGLRSGLRVIDPLIDAIAYGNVPAGHPFLERRTALDISHGQSASRLPFDGKDDDDGASDFQIVTSMTPRQLNAP
jgi:hypothetical protein